MPSMLALLATNAKDRVSRRPGAINEANAPAPSSFTGGCPIYGEDSRAKLGSSRTNSLCFGNNILGKTEKEASILSSTSLPTYLVDYKRSGGRGRWSTLHVVGSVGGFWRSEMELESVRFYHIPPVLTERALSAISSFVNASSNSGCRFKMPSLSRKVFNC